MNYDLLEGEKMVASVSDDTVLLSNIRLRIIEKNAVKSISLNQISFVQSLYKNDYRFLFFALIGVLIIMFIPDIYFIGILLFIVGIVFSFLIKRNFLVINSSGGSLSFQVKGVTVKDINRFIYLIDEQITLYNKK